jgi:hypothetical protein
MEFITGEQTKNALKSTMGSYYQYLESLKSIEEMKGIQARLPYEIHID